MNPYDDFDNLEELDEYTEPENTAPKNRYIVTVELVVRADSVDDATDEVKEIVQEGIIAVIDNQDKKPIEEYDVIESEPASIDWDM